MVAERPRVNQLSYPVTELMEIYQSGADLVELCEYIYQRPVLFKELRMMRHTQALRYLTPIPIARYVLGRIAK